jgi:hypothetical protein
MENPFSTIVVKKPEEIEEVGNSISDNEKNIAFLDEILEKKGREKKPLAWLERERIRVQERENLFKEKSNHMKIFENMLSRYGVEAEIEHIGKNLFEVSLQEDVSDLVEELPEGYAYMGGVVRSILLRELGIHDSIQPRDLDIVRVGNDDSLDDELSEKYMPDDHAQGHGIKQIEKNYFESRDFTINESLVYQGKVYTTKECLLDMVRGIIRFTDNVKEGNKEYGYDKKLMAKGLRLAAEFTEKGINAEVENESYDSEHIDDFHMALHLDRALERGHSVAQEYVNKLIEYDQIPPHTSTPKKLQEYVEEGMGSFVFRFSAKEQYLIENEMVEEYYDYQDDNDLYSNHITEKYEMLPFRGKM